MIDHDRVSKLFLHACALLPAEREAFLDDACEDDAELRAEIEAMLVHDARGNATDALAAPVLAAAAEVPAAAPTRPLPERIGHYRILGLLGEGGMGSVYRAEQTEPIHREVALKVIRGGVESAGIVVRFEAERQALARMDHPAIAKIFDAGTTEDGRPYFVMEHVSGVSITEYCRRHRVQTSERLRLMIQVCEGVHHAHQKAVIHRDLKPSNLLVSMQDGHAQPRIIDFGLAKALAGELTARTLYTEFGAMLGTPEYMSPEQAVGTGQDVDTRTDVYSLGVILYELLTGILPFDSRKLRRDGYFGIQKVLRDEEPLSPSRRLARLSNEESKEVALRTGAEPLALVRRLHGDLDWITMRALEKDRTRRYDSAAEFAADIQRHLADEPVLARPPNVRYRALKFMRRHRIAVLAVGGAGLALLLGVIGTTVGLFHAKQAERAARREAQTSERVAGFLSNMMGGVDPQRMGKLLIRDLGERAPGSGVDNRLGTALSEMSGTDTARRLLDEEFLARAALSIDKEFSDDPLIAARLRQTLARTYSQLGMPDVAEASERRALETRERLLGPAHPDTLDSAALMAEIRYRQGRWQEAEALDRRTLEARARVLGAEHPDTLSSMNHLAFVLRAEDKYDESEDVYQRSLALHRRILGPEHPQTLGVMNDLGFLEQTRGRYQEAERLHRQTLEIRLRRLGRENRDTLWSLYNVAWASMELGKLDEAARLFEQCLDTRRRILGADHPDTLWTLHMLASTRLLQGRYDDAAQLQHQALASQTHVLGATHPYTLHSLALGANIEYRQDRLSESRQDGEKALSSQRALLGDGHDSTVWTLHLLRRTCWAGGWLDEVRRLDQEMVTALCQAAERPEPQSTVLMECAFALLDSGRAGRVDAEAALRHAERAVQLTESKETMPLAALAQAQYTLRDAPRAVETQKNAIAKLERGEAPLRAYLESQLARYQAPR